MLGQPVTYDRIRYFFTDQYDIGMEYTGWTPPGQHHILIARGDPSTNAFQAFWLTDNHVTAGMHINRWDDGIDPINRLIHQDTPVDHRHRLLADRATPLDTLLTPAQR
ncbi:oxidoreductase C-terminal domain-containing protein [Amycolatopsis echigonensis]|uniref:oxidoreductase C-terminal domain-containing protein n=1 Tax=Amycolatopsis echigonensis TaxID=2576905 RepID=UPI001FC99989|nr:oxidoreductase C-terminal domain-containing protein [Amycolatopsis niigatensis]